jgi:hypothetical protein
MNRLILIPVFILAVGVTAASSIVAWESFGDESNGGARCSTPTQVVEVWPESRCITARARAKDLKDWCGVGAYKGDASACTVWDNLERDIETHCP